MLGQFRAERRRRVGSRQLQIARTIAARFGLNIDPTACQFGKRIGQQGFIVKIKIKQDLGGQRAHLAALQIELADKRFHHFSQLSAARHFREIAAAAEHFSLANEQHMHAGHAGIEGHADNVEIVTGIRDKLFLSDSAHRLDLVADPRSFFKLKRGAGFFHSRNQLG